MNDRQWLAIDRKTAEDKLRENPYPTDDGQPVNASLPAESGVILIALLWILTALAVIAMSFSRECLVEFRSARNFQSMDVAYYAARAGIAFTIYQLKLKRLTPQNTQSTTDNTVQDTLDLGYANGTFGDAEYRVDFISEDGKLSLNDVQDQQLFLLLEACGIPDNDAEIIRDSILDWRSASNAQPHTNGAKDDYYQSLNPPYYCKNGKFESVEELLLVRGVTPEYFYGHEGRDQDNNLVYMYGLSRCFTVYRSGSASSVNANAAPLPVLLSTGISIDDARAIINRRLLQPFKDMTDLLSAVPNLGTISSSISAATTRSATIFTLVAAAQAKNSKARRVIRAVVNISQNGTRNQYRTLYWNENIIDYEGFMQDAPNIEGYTQ
jgi:general secretion pathway protein K